MKKIIVLISVAVGIVIGVFFGMLSFKLSAPTALYKEVQINYSFEKTLELVAAKINQKNGWSVVDVIDIQAGVVEFEPNMKKMSIIKFTNHEYSAKMLHNDDSKVMAIQMPYSIVVYEKNDGRVMLGFSNGYFMSRLFAGTLQGDIMQDVIKDMEDILSFIHHRNSSL